MTEYLAGRNIFPQFLTDTEVSVQLFDLWNRVYRYPTEYIIEALAPTTELDFDRLPPEKQQVYRQIQASHIHASPDGPWLFIIARSLAKTGEFQLVGITDTAMLRPQVLLLQEGEVSIGLVCSEKQAIDATLASLASEDARFTPVADHYWNARGGSSTDGGAFLMTVSPRVGVPALAGNGATSEKQKPPKGGTPTGHEVGVPALAGNGATSEKQKPPKGGTPTGHEVGVPALAGNGDRVTGGSLPVASRQPPKGGTPTSYSLRVTNKFGEQISTLPGQVHCNLSIAAVKPLQTARTDEDLAAIERAVQNDDPPGLFAHLRERMEEMDYDRLRSFVDQIVSQTEKRTPVLAIETLTLAIDRRSPTGSKKRSSVLTILRDGLERVFERQPLCGEAGGSTHLRVTWQTRGRIRSPEQGETTLLIDAAPFSGGRGTLQRPAGHRGLPAGLAAHRPLQLPRDAVPWGWIRSRHRRPADRLLRQPGRLPWLGHGRAGSLRPRERPGPALPNRQAGQTGGFRRRGPDVSCTAPRGVNTTSWAMPPAVR